MRKPIKLRVDLQDMPHPVTRTLLVPQSIDMMQMHAVLQIAMGWTFSHLFQFMDTKNRPYIIASFGEFDLGVEIENNEYQAHIVKLKRDFMDRLGRKQLWYLYDLGDYWMHKIRIVKPTPEEIAQFRGEPLCLAATGKCPPENVGSSTGYAEFLTVISDPKHPDYKSYRTWANLDNTSIYNFQNVDISRINTMLSQYFQSKYWKRKTLTHFYSGWADAHFLMDDE